MEPQIADTPSSDGDLRTTPFAQLLVELFEAAETGTLYVHDGGETPLATIRIEAGLPVRARITGSAGSLMQALIPLCSHVEGSFAFAAGEDGISAGPDVVTGRVDPRALIAAAARGPLREDAVAEVVVAVGGNLLKLNPRADLARYGFSPEERKIVDALSEGPIDLVELKARTEAPDRVLRRFLYALRVTHALTILPSARRMQSGSVEHVQALGNASAPPTRPGSYSLVEPDHGMSALDAADDAAIVIDVEDDGSDEHAPQRTQSGQALAHQARAEALLKQRDYAAALREANSALKLGAGNADCQAIYAWALYQHNGAGNRVHPRVWDHLELALKRDPLCDRAHLYKGQLLKRVGRFEESHWHFRRVLQLDHNNIEAAREVRLHEMRRRHTQSSGLVRRLLDRLK
jgi:tetratricopeptide (TPR) repeat protein